MDWKKLGKALLFPPTAIMLILIPIATVFLIYALVFMGHDSIPAILSYVLSFYTLTVWCIQLPRLIPMFRKFREENKYARRFLEDRELRMKVSLYGTLYFNTASGWLLYLPCRHAVFPCPLHQQPQAGRKPKRRTAPLPKLRHRTFVNEPDPFCDGVLYDLLGQNLPPP